MMMCSMVVEADDEPQVKRICCANREADAYFTQRDCIMEHPDEILDLIMSRVLLKARVQASVVSKRWNMICLSPSDILLNWSHCLVTGNSADDVRRSHDELCLFYRDTFINNVNKFLESYRGDHANSFGLRFCLSNSSKDNIDRWIGFAVRMGAQQISIVLCCHSWASFRKLYHKDPQLSLEDIHYVVVNELFDSPQCNLKSLELACCKLGPDFTNHLSSLTSFHLSQLILSECDLKTLFNGLLKLQELVFSRCTLPVELTLTCLPSLKIFKLKHCTKVKQIHLTHIYLNCFEIYSKRTLKFNLVGAPNLMSIGCSAARKTMPYFFRRIAQDSPQFTKLLVIFHEDLRGRNVDNIQIFRSVTRLDLYFKPNSQLEIVRVLSILKAFPILKQLLVVLSDEKNLKENRHHQLTNVDYEPEHLSQVTICGFSGTSSQINFVAYLLKHCNELKKFSTICKKSWEKGARLDFLSKVDGLNKNVKVTVANIVCGPPKVV